MNLGIIGDDLFGQIGGGSTHTVQVLKRLSKYYNIIYFPNPAFYFLYKEHKEDIIHSATNFEKIGIKMTSSFYDILDKDLNFKDIIEEYTKEKIDFVYNMDYLPTPVFSDNIYLLANQVFSDIFSLNYTFILRRKLNVNFGVLLQGLGDLNLNPSHFLYSSLMLSKTPFIPLYRAYQFAARKLLLYELSKAKNLSFISVINKYYYKNINLKFKNIEVLDPCNGVENSEINIFRYTSDIKENKIIFFSRLNHGKGIFELPIILRYFLREHNTKLIVLGSFNQDSEKNYFFRLIDKYNLNNNIIYKGFLNTEDLYKEIASSKLLIYPSHSDSFSIAISQALALHTPVVAYEIPGLQIYRKFKSVKLVKEFDTLAMAKEAIKILRMENIANLFDETVNQFIKIHNWDNVALEHKEILNKYLK